MATPAGERRVVSVLLADIAGSTTIGEQLGAERSKFLFDEVVRLIAGEIKRFGGTVAQLTGDGSMPCSVSRARTRTTPSVPCGRRWLSIRRLPGTRAM